MVTLGAANPVDRTIDLGLWRPDPSIDIEKATNAADADNPTSAEDADSPTGRYIPAGQDVTWSYVVTNTGNTVLENVVVTDDLGTAAARRRPLDHWRHDHMPADDACARRVDDLFVDHARCGARRSVRQRRRCHRRSGAATDRVDRSPRTPISSASTAARSTTSTATIIPVTDDDPSHYFGAIATVDIEKSTN